MLIVSFSGDQVVEFILRESQPIQQVGHIDLLQKEPGLFIEKLQLIIVVQNNIGFLNHKRVVYQTIKSLRPM